MFDKLNEIDWNRFRRGHAAPDIAGLIRGLVSEDYPTREQSWSELGEQLEQGYATGNDLPFVTIPLLIELLEYSGLLDKGLITDLLVFMASFAGDPHEEPYKTRAREIRQAVCLGRNTYAPLFDSESTAGFQEDLQDLMEMCGSE